ncbi:hypothetical protein TPE_1050 [Treponema pedis str. T A4]|uniref:Uncharacterized protein n=1 Tax=Treponema pedis str. T A4 TaxID=1291379 RepID=S6A3G6_9SPIR|nr:hypothetical protein TPE_1050 [Treponema pedis str. T A4]
MPKSKPAVSIKSGNRFSPKRGGFRLKKYLQTLFLFYGIAETP